MKYKRESKRTWRSSAEFDTESDVNDHEPLLSDASVTSRRSFGNTCMFPDFSETSDFESTRQVSDIARSWPASTSRTNQNHSYGTSGRPMMTSPDDDRLSRFRNYCHMKSFIKRENTMPVLSSVPSTLFLPNLPLTDDNTGKQSSLVTVFAVWNTIMGSSLLAMPWGIGKAGLVLGILILIFMGGLCLYTCYLLLRVNQLHSGGNVDWEVPELSQFLLGSSAAYIARAFSIVVLLGAAVVYWILMSNFLYHSVNVLHDAFTGFSPDMRLNESADTGVICPKNFLNQSESVTLSTGDELFDQIWSIEVTAPLFLALLLLPLINFKSATFFTKFNSLGTVSVMYLFIFVAVKAGLWGFNTQFLDQSERSFAFLYKPSSFAVLSGMLALALFIHNIIITIMRNNRYQEKNGRDLSIAFGLVTSTYIVIGVVFYVTFPLGKNCIEDNIFNNFVSYDVMTGIARFLFLFQLTTVFPLLCYMLRIQVFSTIFKSNYVTYPRIITLNVTLVIVCVLFAIFLPRIGTVIRYTGAISGLVYVFTLPVLLHMASLRKRGKLTYVSAFFHALIPIIGTLNLIAQFFITDN